ncbi:MAG: orotate phosphoribosyltransferase [Myxococcales bacterium 68-20]|nr:orotate phosphoribosyltransferase [Myxococcales bacterium]OJY17410.1 MAG: orotate phosphoribosyltransferase [Myxococcales bacterium 68-20]
MADARARLLELLRDRSFARKKVTLASGKESDFFIDCKQTVLTAEGHALTGELMLDAALAAGSFDAIAGVELGGCPLASAASLTSFQRGAPKDAVYVRKDAKDHGSKRLVEGDTRLAPGASLVILEDVTTTGGSTLKAVEKLRAAGYRVESVITLVDRLEGGREAIEAAGLRFSAIYTRRDFIAD